MPDAYLDQVHAVLPRVLALFDNSRISPTYGMGDRFHWAWKLIDFGNGTFQGAANGLAHLVASSLLPDGIAAESILRRIDSIFICADRMRRPDGSMEEAFPFEGSFCVTALVAFDLLVAIDLLGARLDPRERARRLDIIRPMIGCLHETDETHAFISNHLATAAAALFRWSRLTGERGEERGRALLQRVLDSQSKEGWVREYDGADPGYQTLCVTYLADIHRLRPDLDLLEPLAKSVRFLWHFAHPDGSFGGYYGSRNTRFFHPAGVEALAAEIPEAAALAEFMRGSIAAHRTVTLDAMDASNLAPMFNGYCWAAALRSSGERQMSRESSMEIPALRNESMQARFPEAGLLVDAGPKHYTVISMHKGGVVHHVRKDDAKACMVDCGAVAMDSSGRLFSTQAYQPANGVRLESGKVEITAPFAAMHRDQPGPLGFLLLRMLCLTAMRVPAFRSWIKRSLVRRLITGVRLSNVRNRRSIRLGPDLEIRDEWAGASGNMERIEKPGSFSAIHMASQGYWQIQDDRK